MSTDMTVEKTGLSMRLLGGDGLGRHHDRILTHVKQHCHVRELPGEQGMLRIGHLGPDRECSRLGVNLGVGEVHEAAVGVHGLVRKRDLHIRSPGSGGVGLSEVHIPRLALLVVEVGHLELHEHRVALHDGGEQRLSAGTHQSTDVHIAFADVAADRRAHDGVAERKFALGQIRLAHLHLGLRGLIVGYRVVQIQLAGGLLLVERLDTPQGTLRLLGEGLVLLELGLVLVDRRLILPRVYYEQSLVPLHIRALLEKHALEIALDARTHLDELLRPYRSGIFPVDFDVLRLHGLRLHDRNILRFWLPAGQHHHDHHRSHDKQSRGQYPQFPAGTPSAVLAGFQNFIKISFHMRQEFCRTPKSPRGRKPKSLKALSVS